jgi:sRNA-binding carbon storage regulator CsrA
MPTTREIRERELRRICGERVVADTSKPAGMLVLSRGLYESVLLMQDGREIARVEVVQVGGKPRLGFVADASITIVRSELVGRNGDQSATTDTKGQQQ